MICLEKKYFLSLLQKVMEVLENQNFPNRVFWKLSVNSMSELVKEKVLG